MNRSQLRDAVYDRLGVDSTDPRLGTQRVDRLLNDALHWIGIEHDWPWLQSSTTFSTSSSTSTYPVPADWLRTRGLRIAEFSPLDVYDPDELDAYWPLSTSQSRPEGYAVELDQLVLRPIPDAVYVVTHRYIRQEPDLSNDGQSPLMPVSFHPAIAEAAAYLLLRRTREEQRASLALSAYNEWRGRMLGYEQRTRNSPRVRIRDGGWL